jgi:hypothetical protein
MKTPKEKAEELVEKYMPHIAGADRYNTTLGIYNKDISKQCALIAVDEILNAISFNMYDEEEYNKVNDFWEEVKSEIEKV